MKLIDASTAKRMVQENIENKYAEKLRLIMESIKEAISQNKYEIKYSFDKENISQIKTILTSYGYAIYPDKENSILIQWI